MAPHSSTLAWKIPCMEDPGRLQSVGSLRVEHDWVTSLSLFTFIGEGDGNPLQCSCLENPRDGGAWWAAIYGVIHSRTRLKWLSSSSSSSSIVSPSICHEVMGLDAIILVFWMLSFKPNFSLSSVTFSKRLFSSSLLFCHKGGVICTSEGISISPSDLDSTLCFTQPGISHDLLCK